MNRRLSFLRTQGLATALSLAAGLLCFLCTSAANALPPRYIVTEVGPPDLEEPFTPVRINNRGQVVGLTFTGDSPETFESTAFLWSPFTPNSASGSTTILESTGPGAQYVNTFINNYGQVLLTSIDFVEEHISATLWMPTAPNGATGNAVNVATLLGLDETTSVEGWGINDIGQLVADQFEVTTNDPTPYLWTPSVPNGVMGSAVELEAPEEITSPVAAGINNYGQVIGWDLNTGDSFLWTPSTPNGDSGTAVSLEPIAGHTPIFPQDINDLGQIVGVNQLTGLAPS